MQKRVRFLAAILALCSATLLRGASGLEEFFGIMPWDNAPNDSAVLRELKECGFTLAGFVEPKTLDACHAAGLKAIVKDRRITSLNWKQLDEVAAWTNIAAVVEEVGRHPALFGYYLLDEPGVDSFAGLGRASALLRELSPGKWPYINLFPNYATAEQLGTSRYEDYLERYVETCRPPIVSYDHYALMNNGTLREGYWLNLEQIRALALRHRLPFWNIVLSTAHYDYRVPTDADFRFQVYSTLAYGGRGINYFVYFGRTWLPHLSAISTNGQRTEVWYRMQAVNRQVLRLAPTLLKLRSDAVYHFGKPPTGCSGPPPDSLVSGVNHPDFMAGDFTHRDGSRYVMLVNKDLTWSHVCEPQFRAPPRKLRMVCPETGRLVPFEGARRWIPAGGGVLLKL